MSRAELDQIVSGALGGGAASSPAEVSALAALLAMEPSRDANANPVSHGVQSAVVARAKRLVPGGITQGARYYSTFSVSMDTGTYAALFYPSTGGTDPNEDIVGGALDEPLWLPFSIAVLCQTIYHVASGARSAMRKDEIDRAVEAANAQMSGHLRRWYAGVFRRVLPGFAPLVTTLGGDLEASRKYLTVLRSDNWIAMTNERIRSGQAGDLEWSLYHHWIKLLALSGDEAPITSVAGYLKEKLLVFPDTVRAESWSGYRVWLLAARIDYDLFREAEPRILKPVPYFTSNGMNEFPEGYARELLQEGPGKPYWNGSQACFAAGTKIRMADGSLQPIEALRRGDRVASASGSRAVATMVAVPRDGRPLFSIRGSTARFTSLHAFFNAAGPGAPRYLAIDARRAGMISPTFQEIGIGRLDEGSRVLAHSPDGPVPVTVEGVEEETGDGEPDEKLYDVVLEPDETGSSEYFAGDDRRQLLVSSDFPLFTRSPLLARAALAALGVVRETLSRIDPAPSQAPDWTILAAVLSDEMLPIAVRRASALDPAEALADHEVPPLPARVAGHMDAFTSPGLLADAAEYNASAGRLGSQLLSDHADEIAAAVEMGWRTFPEIGPDEARGIAVSVLSARLDADHAIPMETRLHVAVALASGVTATETIREHEGARQTQFVRSFHDVAYFASRPPEDAVRARVLGLDLHLVDDEGTVRWVASGRIAWPPPGGYRHAQAILRTDRGVDCGTLGFDVRILSRQEMDQERAARAAWGSEQRERFAEALGRECGVWLNDRLTRWLEVGLCMANMPHPPALQTSGA